VKSEKEALEMQLSEGSSELLEALEASVNRLKNDETFQAAEHKAQLLELMMHEIDALKITNANTEQVRVDYRCTQDHQRQHRTSEGRLSITACCCQC